MCVFAVSVLPFPHFVHYAKFCYVKVDGGVDWIGLDWIGLDWIEVPSGEELKFAF